MQPGEGQPGRGANRCVAVQGELREGVLSRGEDHARAEGTPKMAPVAVEREYFRGAAEEHGQLEAPQGHQDGLEKGRFEVVKVPGAQVVQGEGRQLGWRTDAEAGRERADDGCLESEATPVVGTKLVIINWVERQIDGLDPGQLVNARK